MTSPATSATLTRERHGEPRRAVIVSAPGSSRPRQGLAGRSPRSTCARDVAPGPAPRSSGWVTPTQRLSVGRTANGSGRSRSAISVGRRARGGAPPPRRRAAMAASKASTSEVEKAHRFMDTRVSGSSTSGSRPSPVVEAPVATAGRRRAARRCWTRRPSAPVLADAPGHRRVADDRPLEGKPTRALSSLGALSRGRPGSRSAGGSVEVVGVGDPEPGPTSSSPPGREHGVDGAPGAVLDREAHVDRGGQSRVRRGRGWIVSGVGADHHHDGREPGVDGVARRPGRRWPRRPARRGRAASARRRSAWPARPPGRPGRAPSSGAGHAPQRRTALAQLMPPPKPVSRRRSPSRTRPLWTTSSRARGIDAEEVLP